MHEDGNMFTVHELLYVFFPTRNIRVLARVLDRPVHTRTPTRGTHTTHTRIRGKHTWTAVIHARIVGHVAVRRKLEAIVVTMVLRFTTVAVIWKY